MLDFDKPGVFTIEPVECDPERVGAIMHRVTWIPEGWTGVPGNVGHIVTDRGTAAMLAKRLNAHRELES